MSQKGTRWVAVAAIVTMLGVVGAATALGRTRAGNERPASDQAIPSALASPGPNDLAGSIDLDEPVDLEGTPEGDGKVVSPASDPRAAVEGFVAAEQAGDLARSYQFLSATDREQLPSEQDWVAAHADLFPPVTDYEIGEAGRASDATVIESTLRLESSLDEVIGLVPARAVMRWRVVEGPAGRWSVDLAGSELEPQLPPDDDAVAATERWVQSRQRCAGEGEWEGGLVGFPGLADGLCNKAGEVVVGRPGPLGDLDVEQLVSTFGENAVTWARVVPVERPAALRAVLAPIADRWVVIAVLDREL
jgi:hypothetical protein